VLALFELQLQLLLAPTCGSGSTETRRALLGGRLKPMRVICPQHLKRLVVLRELL
jgi:hypothetical protein